MTRTILIVDADSNIRASLQAILEQEGYDIIHADSGEQALAIVRTLQIDVFLLDIGMSGIDGITLCRSIRDFDRHHRTPIIFLIGSDNEDAVENAFSAGGDDFMVRRGSAAAVRKRVKSHLQRVESERRVEWFRGLLKLYVSKRTLDVVEKTSTTGQLPPPQEQDLAICFTDIRSFTAFAEETEPSCLFALVSALLADQVQIIHEFGGYVDKFGGDGVMAIFEGPDMVVQSCLCALRILESIRSKDMGVTAQGFGIGIHSGRAVIGNIGSPEHLDYSAIGSAVNLAARLCGQAQAMSIVVSKAVRDTVADDSRLSFNAERRVRIRGIKEPVTVYTLSRR